MGRPIDFRRKRALKNLGSVLLFLALTALFVFVTYLGDKRKVAQDHASGYDSPMNSIVENDLGSLKQHGTTG